MIVNAVVDAEIYLATPDSSEWSDGVAGAAASGAVTGFLGASGHERVPTHGHQTSSSAVSRAGPTFRRSLPPGSSVSRNGTSSCAWASTELPSLEGKLEAYRARLAAAGVTPRFGDCQAGEAGDANWLGVNEFDVGPEVEDPRFFMRRRRAGHGG